MSVLSPRAYVALTATGDGKGMHSRLEEEIRRRMVEQAKCEVPSGEGDLASRWAAAERSLLRPASDVEDEGRLTFYEWQELQGLRAREKEHAVELQQLQKRLEEAEGPQHLKVKALEQELSCTDQLLVERNQHCRKVELERSNLNAALKKKDQELKDLREELAAAKEQTQVAQKRMAEKDAEAKALQRKCERLERSLKETVVLESCGQQQSKICRSQSGGMLAERPPPIMCLKW
ncbi:unnamed protein product [Symbiodinium pilosum]|uniref:Uncharacterized protein n=1 Tax=Symbiodinium pilosum TaxID=2952 RepID=A0A812VYZ9_SYMPI|nr:unnamed protein product [Symbiodinium pilosum]